MSSRQGRLPLTRPLVVGANKPIFVIGAYHRLSFCTRQRNVKHLLVGQIGGATVGMDQDPLGGLPRAA